MRKQTVVHARISMVWPVWVVALLWCDRLKLWPFLVVLLLCAVVERLKGISGRGRSRTCWGSLFTLYSRRYLSVALSGLLTSLIAMFMEPTWGPPGSCRPQMDPMLAVWTLLSAVLACWNQVRSLIPGTDRNTNYTLFVKLRRNCRVQDRHMGKTNQGLVYIDV